MIITTEVGDSLNKQKGLLNSQIFKEVIDLNREQTNMCNSSVDTHLYIHFDENDSKPIFFAGN